MRIMLIAVGRLKQGPERELADRYRKRAADSGRGLGIGEVEIVELRESRAASAEQRMLEESIAIANVVPERAPLVLLDERGESLSSAALAGHIQLWREEARPAAAFVIGGADGLAPALRDRQTLSLAFGAATWPHQMVRIMILEQIYRAMTIITGHPYHRG
ncbi:MAG TPA: 23S rRNA (pseudouridine(1915)-N(3))-methyltransferase RlmH [Xanthobacteraceae bacterium]|nr:23S rRNA (pseudouridine(1915)-N(3))-methyltransferase RlmH [Xanthobacteraceae bacterium]